jgi:two-component system response regulator MprA
VLIVEDDAPVRRMLERSLRAEGFRVQAVADGGAALAAAESSAPDLVVLDRVRLFSGNGGREPCARSPR